MKVRMNRHELAEALGAIGNVVAARTPKPILQCVLIEAQADACVLVATDLEVGLRFTASQVEVERQGQVVVPADKLAQIVRESVDEVVSFELEDTVCHVRDKDAHYEIIVADAGDFPAVAGFEGEGDFAVEAKVLHRLAEWTVFAAAKENTRYAINGVLWEREGKTLTFVATDGRRLSLARGTMPAAGAHFECIVPVKAMHLAQRIFHESDDKVEVRVVGNQMVLASPRAVLSTVLVEGQFPRYRDVIPVDCPRKVVLPTQEFYSAVRRAALLSNEESRGVRLAFSEGMLTLSGRSPSHGQATSSLPVEFSGEPLEIGFNPVFLTEVLRVVADDNITLELKETNRPGVVHAGENYLHVIMPVSLS